MSITWEKILTPDRSLSLKHSHSQLREKMTYRMNKKGVTFQTGLLCNLTQR